MVNASLESLNVVKNYDTKTNNLERRLAKKMLNFCLPLLPSVVTH